MKQEKMSLKIAPAEMMPEAVEVMPEDGQTENLPEPQLDAMTEESAAVGLPDFSPTMTTNEGFYSRDEFRQNFNSFLEFLENPATATDAFSTIVGRGRDLSADKIYQHSAETAAKENLLCSIIHDSYDLDDADLAKILQQEEPLDTLYQFLLGGKTDLSSESSISSILNEYNAQCQEETATMDTGVTLC